MNEAFLIHYYYGDRYSSFRAGLGAIIRAKGQSLKIRAILINDSFSWLSNLTLLNNLDVVIYDLSHYKAILDAVKKNIIFSEKSMLLAANFDLLIENNLLSLEKFIDIILDKNKKTEIVLTGETKYSQLLKIADYASNFKLVKN